MSDKELKKCPFFVNSCDVVSGLNQITFFSCVNEQCLAVISFGKAQSMKLAVNKFNKRKG